MKFILTLIISLALMPSLFSVFAGDDKPLPVVESVELSRYMGKWYEIARIPNKFQKDCVSDVSAVYTLLDNNNIRVVNECRKSNGDLESAEGKGKLASKKGPNSKLKVRFAPSWLSWLSAVWGDYQIIELGPEYEYSLVGTPSREYLWILSRTPQMDDVTFEKLRDRAAALDFDVSKLIKTKQAG